MVTTTQTLYFAGYTTTIKTTNSRGEPTTIATFIPPSTLIVIKTVPATAVTAAPVKTTKANVSNSMDSMATLHDISHSLWSVTISLSIVAVTLIFMIFV